RRSSDKAGPAVAQRDIGDQHKTTRRHESGVSENLFAVPRVFRLQGAVKKSTEKGQTEERFESDPAAKPEYEKRDQDAKDQDDQGRVKTDPGQSGFPRFRIRPRRPERPQAKAEAGGCANVVTPPLRSARAPGGRAP